MVMSINRNLKILFIENLFVNRVVTTGKLNFSVYIFVNFL